MAIKHQSDCYRTFKLMADAAAHGETTEGAVKCRAFPRRNAMPHQSAHRFAFYINGNRTSKSAAERFLGA